MKRFLLKVVLLSGAVAAPACAVDQGFFLGASAGRAMSDYAGAKSVSAFSVDAGYKYNRNLALEAQYSAFGDMAAAGAGSEKISGFKLAAVGIYPFNDQWGVFGDVGMGILSTKLSGTGTTADGTYSKTGVAYGVGLHYNVDLNLSVRLTVDRYKIGGTQGGGYGMSGMSLPSRNLSVIALGANYVF